MADREIIDYQQIQGGLNKVALTAGMVLPAQSESGEETLELDRPAVTPVVIPIRRPKKPKWIIG
jgi:hypothetical protein